jgi:hypothetical protein
MTTTFLYTEMQASIPFDQFDWEQANASLKQAPGLLSKTWLAGLGTHTIGGLYQFDSVENALGFAHGPWNEMATQVGAAASTRIFDADATEAASRDMDSPYYG